jgi:acetyl esterase/lipase
MARTILALALVVTTFSWSRPTLAQAVVPTDAAVVFAELGGRALRLDYYAARSGTGARPMVVWLHDGGWLSGDRSLPAFVAPLLDRGISIASIDYRLTVEAGLYGANGVSFPAQIHDVKGAIRFLRVNATRFNLDIKRMAAWGSSSGGHLAALAATSGNNPQLEGTVGGNLGVSSIVQAAVDYYGPTDLLRLTTDVTTPPGSIVDHDSTTSPGALLLGFTAPGQGIAVLRNNANNASSPYPNYLDLAHAASPISHVDAQDPPIYIVHGTADPQVALRQSERLRDALTAAGGMATYVPVAGGGHGGFGAAVHTGAIDFLANTLAASTVPVSRPLSITGPWYEPATSGQGFELQWLNNSTLLVFFYGHQDDGDNLFLVGARSGRLNYGEEIIVPMAITTGGRFNNLDANAVNRANWGTLRLRLLDCGNAIASMTGLDGTETYQLVRLANIDYLSCE